MEFTKDIEFSKKLKENEESTITYKGYLYQKNSQEVTMVYGYGDSWDNTSNALMAKTDHGFEATIKLASNYDTFNFCFKNENNEWDNNYGYNFISPIVPSFVSPFEQKEDLAYHFEEIAQRSLLEEIKLNFLDNLLDQSVNYEEFANKFVVPEEEAVSTAEKQQILEDILAESEVKDETVNYIVPDVNEIFEMNKIIEEIFSPAKEEALKVETKAIETVEPNTVDVAELATPTPVETPDYHIADELAAVIENPELAKAEPKEEVSREVQMAEIKKDLGTFIDELIEELDKPVEENVAVAETTEATETVEPTVETPQMAETLETTVEAPQMAETLEPEVEDTLNDLFESDKPEEKAEEKLEIGHFENEALVATREVSNNMALIVKDIDSLVVSPRKLSKVYLTFKKIRLAIYKLITAVPRMLEKGLQNNENR